MKSFLSLLLLTFVGFTSVHAEKYRLDMDAVESAFSTSVDVTFETADFLGLTVGAPNGPQALFPSENPSSVTAGIIALGTILVGGFIAGTVFSILTTLTAGFGFFIFWPILFAPALPWHRFYLGMGGEGFKVGALYCVTGAWCGWLTIIDGIMLLLDDEGGQRFVQNPKWVMWIN